MIDWNKPIQTRDGSKAKPLGPSKEGEHWIAYQRSNSSWTTYAVFPDGRYSASAPDSSADIINVPERVKVEGFLGIFSSGYIHVYGSKELAAKNVSGEEGLAIIDLEELFPDGIEVGRGL